MKRCSVGYIVSGFPSKEDAAKGVFNLRAVKKISSQADVTVFHIRSWRPGRQLYFREHFEGIDVVRLNLLRIPKLKGSIKIFNEKVNARLAYIFLKKELQNLDVLHSVYISYGGILGSYFKSRLNSDVIHVSQAIGSDINSQLKEYLTLYPFNPWRKNIDGIICNSKALESKVKSNFKHVTYIETIYRGIDIVNDGPSLEAKEDKMVINLVFLGGFAAYSELQYGKNTKGGLTLMKAWEMLDKEIGHPYQLTLGGPDSDSEFVHEWIEGLEQNEKVNIVGYLSPSEVQKSLKMADVLVIPSLEEGLPNLLLEGMMHNTAIIASTVGGIPEVIDTTSAVLVAPEDHKAIYEGLIQLRDVSIREEKRKKALSRLKSKFNAEHYGNYVVQFYKEILENNTCVE